MIFPYFFQPDQGYYTAQPATVEQLQNLFRHVAFLRDELGRFMTEAQQFPDAVDKVEKLQSNFHSLSLRLDSAMSNIAINKNTLLKTVDEVQQLTSDALTAFAIRGDDNTLILSLSNDEGKEVEKKILFTSDDIATTVASNGTVIKQTVTALNGNVHAPKWGLKTHDDGIAVTYDDVIVHTFEVHNISTLEGAPDEFLDTSTLALSTNDNVIKFTLDSSKAAKAFTMLDDGLSALAADAVTDIKLSTEVAGNYRSVDFVLTTEDGGVPTVQRITAGIENELSVRPADGGFVIKALDQLERINPFQYERVNFARDKREITVSTQEMRGDDTGHWKPSENFNNRAIRIAESSSEGLLAVDWAPDDTISIDDSVMRAYVDNKESKLEAIIAAQAEAIKELSGRIATLETMRTESITDAFIVVEPASHDVLKITLEKYRSDGTKDLDVNTVRLSNVDHALRYDISDGSPSNAAIIDINLDKKWLTRQGLKPDMDTI